MTQAPCPLIEIAIEPKSTAGREKLDAALQELTAEDPSFRVVTDPESGQTILKGMSELHLAGKTDALRDTYNVDANIGAPQVAFREKITKAVTRDYTHKQQSSGTGEFARVKIRIEPNETDRGFEFLPKMAGDAMPEEYLAGIEKGLRSVLGAGVVAGFPVAGIKMSLIDGAWHAVDSSPLAFELAARHALREALLHAGSVLLEPVMTLEIITPDQYARPVIDDLRSRRGRIQREDGHNGTTTVRASTPLAALFGYEARLAALSDGHAKSSMVFQHYAPVPVPHEWEPPPAAAMALRA